MPGFWDTGGALLGHLFLPPWPQTSAAQLAPFPDRSQSAQTPLGASDSVLQAGISPYLQTKSLRSQR